MIINETPRRIRRELRSIADSSFREDECSQVSISSSTLLNLIDDADRLSFIVKKVQEFASSLEYCDKSVSIQEVKPLGRELREILIRDFTISLP